MPTKPKVKQKKWFNWLAEAIVTIVILMFLFAIFFPMPSRGARESARRIYCVNNLKQIGSALQQYTQEYNETLPPATLHSRPYPVLLRTYIQDPDVYKCRSNPSAHYLDDASSSSTYLNHYLANGGEAGDKRVAGGLRPMARNRGVEISKIAAPTQCILVAEWNSDLDANESWKGEPDLYNTDKMDFQGHRGTTNFLFADGHVKSLRPILTVQGVNMWSIDNTNKAPTDLRKQIESETMRLAGG